MKAIITLVCTLIIIQTSYAQGNNLALRISAAGLESVKSVQTKDGALFVAGMFRDSLFLIPDEMITTSAPYNFFIAKYDEQGALIQQRLFQTDYEFKRNLTAHLEIDPEDNLLISGNFYQGILDEAGDTLLYTLASLDYFLMKLAPDLTLDWISVIGGSNNTDFITAIPVRDDGSFSLVGSLNRQFDYDLSDSIQIMEASGSGDPILAHYHPDRSLIWARIIPSTKNDQMLGTVVNSQSETFSIQRLSDTCWLEFANDTLMQVTIGQGDLILQKWDVAGVLLSTQSITGTGEERYVDMAMDKNDQLYLLTQSNSESVSILGTDLTRQAFNDYQLTKIEPDGKISWLNQIPTSQHSDAATGLQLINDTLVFYGNYESNMVLNTRGEPIDHALVPGSDFIASYSLEGDFLGAEILAGSQVRAKGDQRYFAEGSWIVTAPLTQTTTFNDGPNGTLEATGISDWVVLRYSAGQASTTATADFEAAQLSVYPNPVLDLLSITWEAAFKAEEMQIYDVMGRKLVHRSLEAGQQILSVPVSDFVPGQYLVRINSGQSFAVVKFLKK